MKTLIRHIFNRKIIFKFYSFLGQFRGHNSHFEENVKNSLLLLDYFSIIKNCFVMTFFNQTPLNDMDFKILSFPHFQMCFCLYNGEEYVFLHTQKYLMSFDISYYSVQPFTLYLMQKICIYQQRHLHNSCLKQPYPKFIKGQ